MTERLLQDETQDRETKGLCRWFASKLDARRRVRELYQEIYEAGGGDAARDALLAKGVAQSKETE